MTFKRIRCLFPEEKDSNDANVEKEWEREKTF